MKISCPDCSQRIKISEEDIPSLLSETDFACPACGAAVPTSLLQPEASLGGMAADQLLMRGMNTPQFSGPGGWEPPTTEELAALLDSRYEIFRLLGRGGMGAVYQARDNRLGRLVAIKILPQVLMEEPGALERFEREARALAALDHPHIVKIHDYGQANDGSPFIIMEFVRGRDIQTLRDSGELDLPNALRLISETCSALHYAHLKGIIHRDIKPANILVSEDGSAKVADFGLAKVESTHSRPMPDNSLTITGQVMGTPTYMAPEQEAGEIADHRADIYALGVTLYNLLTGSAPKGAWSLPSQKLQIDVRLDEIVLKALQEKPEARYQAARDLQVDLDSVRSQTGGSALPPGVAPEPLPSSVGSVPPSSHHSRSASRVKLTVPADNQPAADEILATTRSLNNTMLILGLLAIGVIGGLAIYLANRKTGDTFHTQTSISTSVTNNTFFTQIIAAGLATSADLAAIADIRPRGETLIGISKEPLAWNEARDLAAKIGATILPLDNASGEVDEPLATWMRENFASHLISPVWVSSGDKPYLCDAAQNVPATELAALHRVILVWNLPKTTASSSEPSLPQPPTAPTGLAVEPPTGPDAPDAFTENVGATGESDPPSPTQPEATASTPSAPVGLLSWISTDGKTIQAEFVRLDGEAVVIRMNGKEFTIPFSRLSPGSIEQARKLANP
jgi:serine/threonine protein kinase